MHSNPFHSPDTYASVVVAHLAARHRFTRKDAIGIVQNSEASVRNAFVARVQPEFLAARLARNASRITARNVAGLAAGSSDEPSGKIITSQYGWNLASLNEQYERRRRGTGRSGSSAGEAPIKTSKIVCVSDGWSPNLFVPSDRPASININSMVTPEQRQALVDARGSRDPKDLKDLLEKIKKRAERGFEPTSKQAANRAEIRERMMNILNAQDKAAIILGVPNSVVSTNKNNTTWLSGGAMMVQKSGNEKIVGRNVSTTYASVEHTCPISCAQRGVACYAETSNNILPIIQMLTHIANVNKRTPEGVAEDEARAIDASFPNGISEPTDLRIHTVGDARSRTSVRMIASAAHRWATRSTWRSHFTKRNEPPPVAWSYTHAWYEHSREDWGPVSTLASIQTPSNLVEAKRRGWAPAIVVPHDFFEKRPSFDPITGEPIAFTLEGDTTKWLPCPAQNPDESKAVGCTHCRLCLDDQKLRRDNFGIAFHAHSSGTVKGVPFRHPQFREDLIQLRRRK